MTYAPARPGAGWSGADQSVIELPWQAEFCTQAMLLYDGQALSTGALGSGTWTVANQGIFYEFWVYEPTTVYKLGWINGSAAGGNTCVALYNSDTNARLATTGPTLRVGNSLKQYVDTADTLLLPGQSYRAAMSHDSVTANQSAVQASNLISLPELLLAQLKVQASVATLPDPCTPVDPTAILALPTILLATMAATG